MIYCRTTIIIIGIQNLSQYSRCGPFSIYPTRQEKVYSWWGRSGRLAKDDDDTIHTEKNKGKKGNSLVPKSFRNFVWHYYYTLPMTYVRHKRICKRFSRKRETFSDICQNCRVTIINMAHKVYFCILIFQLLKLWGKKIWDYQKKKNLNK
jgi:hypothetical protein